MPLFYHRLWRWFLEIGSSAYHCFSWRSDLPLQLLQYFCDLTEPRQLAHPLWVHLQGIRRSPVSGKAAGNSPFYYTALLDTRFWLVDYGILFSLLFRNSRPLLWITDRCYGRQPIPTVGSKRLFSFLVEAIKSFFVTLCQIIDFFSK